MKYQVYSQRVYFPGQRGGLWGKMPKDYSHQSPGSWVSLANEPPDARPPRYHQRTFFLTDRYCPFCGKPLSVVVFDGGYNPKTGDRTLIFAKQCLHRVGWWIFSWYSCNLPGVTQEI